MSNTTVSPTTPALPRPDFDRVMDKLRRIARNHLLLFRLEVGRSLGEDFFGGDRAIYADTSPNKAVSFTAFVTERADELEDLGLNANQLRQSLLCWFAAADLPKDMVRRLLFSHLVELARVKDDPTRRLLAQATIANGWTRRALHDAVLAALSGQWIDADAETPGLQPPPAPTEPEPVAKAPAAGRVVTRFEKSADDLDDLVSQWEAVDVGRLTKLQKDRMASAVGRLKQKVAALEAKLAGGASSE